MAGRIFFVHVPNAAQSTVLLMEHGPLRTAPDYFANTIMASVFGGSFTSRLNMNLREDKGYAYGARGGLSYSKHYGALTASASVQTDATYQSLLEISTRDERSVDRQEAGHRRTSSSARSSTRRSRCRVSSPPHKRLSVNIAASCTTGSHSTTSIRTPSTSEE